LSSSKEASEPSPASSASSTQQPVSTRKASGAASAAAPTFEDEDEEEEEEDISDADYALITQSDLDAYLVASGYDPNAETTLDLSCMPTLDTKTLDSMFFLLALHFHCVCDCFVSATKLEWYVEAKEDSADARAALLAQVPELP